MAADGAVASIHPACTSARVIRITVCRYCHSAKEVRRYMNTIAACTHESCS